MSGSSRKRARLAASLQDIATQVQDARTALRQARQQQRRREVGKTGCRRTNTVNSVKIDPRVLAKRGTAFMHCQVAVTKGCLGTV